MLLIASQKRIIPSDLKYRTIHLDSFVQLPAIDAGNYFWARDDPETLLPIGYESISEWVESFAKDHLQDSHSTFTLRLFFVQHGAACLYLNDMKPIFETTCGIRQAKLP